jgi:SAM-dependent methyltransferase
VSLIHRHKIEQRSHDQASAHERTDFYAWGALQAADDYAYARLGNVRGLRVLDLGCGDGRHAARLASEGALVTAIDISFGMARATDRRIIGAGLESAAHAVQMSAEYLGFAERAFDLIFGHSVLHHTDLGITRREIKRMLRPGGRAIFLEPLDHNPVLNLFRFLTPWRRTPTEKPLRDADLRYIAEPFSALHQREFYLVALAAFALVPLRNARLFQATMRALLPIDDWLFACWPRLKRYAWAVVLELQA